MIGLFIFFNQFIKSSTLDLLTLRYRLRFCPGKYPVIFRSIYYNAHFQNKVKALYALMLSKEHATSQAI